MKYQLEYDKCLLTAEAINYQEKNEYLVGISLWLRFSDMFDSSGISKEQSIEVNGKSFYLSSLVTVSYSSETKTFSFVTSPDYKGTYEIVGYEKDIAPEKECAVSQGVLITKEEFEFILSKYGEHFKDDSSLQTGAYGIHALED